MLKLSVLIVDDEEGMRLGADRSLEGFVVSLQDFSDEVSFEVRCAETGTRALELIDEHAPDIMLLDYKLPDITGIDVLERASDKLRGTLTVMITAFATLEVAVAATKRGAFDFLAKPFTPEELRATMGKASRHIYLHRRAKKLEEEKMQVRFEFISVLAHELKSPLAAVEGYLHIINDRLKGPELASYDSVIERSVVRIGGMRKLVMDLLDLTRLESGRKKRQIEQVSVTAAAQNVADGLSEQARTADVALTLNIPADLRFNADTGELEMIFSNLLSNAVKYNKKGGRAELSARRTATGALELKCSDTGIGMSAEEQARLFKEFSRIKNESTKGIEGSGLGLSILQKLVKLYEGNIVVESAPGKGTVFSLTLKDAAVPAQGAVQQ
ncbi:MAG TPA: hybrid sensor histidine kinase/response regulator [Elusimicrobiales bacterium]|nr:hybrid sensor histidine kinase/response regulator [Elusimicrobiales bacterium]